MLKPFLVRDLHEDPYPQDIIEDTASDLYNATDASVGSQRRHGLVQITAADYDEIAYIHPQARLTYLDDDDGDIITVGSSLELAQRLDEPASHNTDTGFLSTIHLFDIRRTKSVIDIWKRYGSNERQSVPESPNTKDVITDLNDNRTRAEPEERDTSREQESHAEDERTTATENEPSESFLSAFETEMARMMNESRRSENNAPESTTSSRTTQAESTTNPPRETTDAFGSALRSLMEVAELIKSGVRSKLPELERHLDNARRALPNDITDSMRSAFLAFEEQVKAMVATLNNLPETVRRDNAPGSTSLFSEFSTTHNAMNGLRELSVQFGSLGQTLIDAFESSIRGAFPGQADSFFSSFPSFSESTNQQSSAPNNEPGNSSSHRESPAFGQTSDNPVVFPSHQSTNAPNAPYSVPPPASCHPFWGSQFPYIPPFHWPACSSGFGPIPFTASPGFGTATDFRQTRPNPSEPPSLEPHPSRSLFIGNVGFNVTQAMIRDVFSSKGLVVGVNLPVDSRSGKHAGFGYLTFATDESATRAMKELQGTVIDGHRINLEYVDHAPITTVVSPEAEGSEPETTAPQMSGVIRHDTVEDPLISVPEENADPKTENNTVHDMLLAQTEARFPPVSQLDAHMLAGQPSGTSQSDTSSRTKSAEETQRPIITAAGDYVGSYGPFPGASSQGPSGLIQDSADIQPITTPHHLPSHRTLPFRPNPHYHHPRRAATMREPEPHRRSFDPFEPQPGLRRRATERHSLRGQHRGRMGPRHRPSFHQLSQPPPEQTPNLSAPEEEPEVQEYRRSSRKEQNQRAIDECVSALADMGFGDEEGGGRQRLEIYAAAAKGDLVEAIEMIEEERKAYEQREQSVFM
ncbi:hypothetical protein BDW67DRAFT_158412 [Aspergillus spinulosporus]